VSNESIGIRQPLNHSNTRTKAIFWQSTLRDRLLSFDKIVIIALLFIHYSLLQPINVSGSFFLRLFTADKVIYYLALIVILRQVLLRRRFYVIRQIPGVWLLIPVVFLVFTSNYLGTKSGVSTYSWKNLYDITSEVNYWKTSWQEIGKILLMITTVLVLNSYSKIFFYLKWSLYFIVFLALVSFLPLEPSDIFPDSQKAYQIEESIRGQTTLASYTDYSTTKRHTMLWIDSNNYAYFLIPALFVIILLINYGQRVIRPHLRFVLFLIFGFLAVNLLLTQSRGGLFCFLGGFTVLLYQYREKRNQWIIPIMVFVFGSFLAFFFTGMGEIIQNLFTRFYYAFLLVGDESARQTVSGAESGRVITAWLAIQDILERPLLGWGGAFQVGRFSTSGNHVGYLNLIGKYGFIGGGLMFLFLYKNLRSFQRTLRKTIRRDSFELHMGYCIVAIYIAVILSGLFRTFSPIGIAPLAISFYLVSKYNTRRPEVS